MDSLLSQGQLRPEDRHRNEREDDRLLKLNISSLAKRDEVSLLKSILSQGLAGQSAILILKPKLFEVLSIMLAEWRFNLRLQDLKTASLLLYLCERNLMFCKICLAGQRSQLESPIQSPSMGSQGEK